ncbi:MAG: membrane protein insertase YidC [Alphaproteobacteria bacterium]|nr:membrane protein insertase YidC [Alphaproteobacteria bacterium]
MEQRNLLLAIAISLAVIFGFQFFMDSMYPERDQPVQTTDSSTPIGDSIPRPAAPSGAAPTPETDRAQVLAESPRVEIDNPVVDGSLALRGARLDDLKLKKFRETVDPTSPEVTLLSPGGSDKPYYSTVGWVSDQADLVLPDGDTLWQSDGDKLTDKTPVTLTWNNGAGLIFTRTISIDESYMFEITQSVRNVGNQSVNLFPYSIVSRTDPPPVLGFFILHEGPIGVLDGTLKEIDYDELQDENTIEFKSNGGWIGITDKYWLVSLIPNQDAGSTGRFSYSVADGRNRYQTDFIGGGREIAPGATITVTSHLFAGAKEVQVLDAYSEQYGIDKFDRAIDFGWFYFLTKPLFYVLIYINEMVGNFGVAILLLTVLIKLIMFPLANKSYRSMSRMKALQPEIMSLRERFGDDKQRLNQEMMAMYKDKKVSPASGCLPIAVQIPVFFALYKVLFVTIEMRHAPFFGWIQDLSAPDPTTVFNAFGLIPFTPPEFLLIGAWPLIMGISMFLQQKLNPQPPDPIQARIFMFLPIIFTFLLARFPSGLVIYWAWNNVLSIGQQWMIMRGVAKADAAAAAKKAGSPAPAAAGNTSQAGDKSTKEDESEAEDNDGDETEHEEAAPAATTTSAARGKNRGRNKRRSRGGRR